MDEVEHLWALVEKAWEPLGPETNQARHALAHRAPTPEEDLYAEQLATVEGALEGFLANLSTTARDLPPEELTALDRTVERLLHDIDRADVHQVTGGSDDGFLYARGFIVALGRDFYTAVTRDPRMAVPDAWCERMPYLFAHLHSERFGDFPDTGSRISRESFSNPHGWR
ncbi:DUF4240 domain-containing protein [Spirillospora albida]|uniref:DUF4240 domain-containing protein n=1 Tax=Spirillospora albida TaxID=58123 RepID=UPI00056D99C3|nr:DUF4240 domain-containing protein [Spirillospora albida]